jgi:hypothetical protein
MKTKDDERKVLGGSGGQPDKSCHGGTFRHTPRPHFCRYSRIPTTSISREQLYPHMAFSPTCHGHVAIPPFPDHAVARIASERYISCMSDIPKTWLREDNLATTYHASDRGSSPIYYFVSIHRVIAALGSIHNRGRGFLATDTVQFLTNENLRRAYEAEMRTMLSYAKAELGRSLSSLSTSWAKQQRACHL